MRRRIVWVAVAVILFACGNHSFEEQSIEAPPGSSVVAQSSSSSSGVVAQSSSSSSSIVAQSSSVVYCKDFDENEKRTHYGKEKRQICDRRDGTKYVYVSIGNKDWLAENLNLAKDQDGNSIGRCYQDKSENCEIYGRLYMLSEAKCPEGWHLPSHPELAIMLKTADPNYKEGDPSDGQGQNNSGVYLKTTSGWAKAAGTGAPANGNGYDIYGFSALPGGYCGGGCETLEGDKAVFRSLGAMSYWWTTSVGAPVPLSITWAMDGNYRVNDAMQSYPVSRFYARCLRD